MFGFGQQRDRERLVLRNFGICSQNLLRRLLRHYGVESEGGMGGLPPDAQELLAGMVAYGADINEGTVPGTNMDEYFVDHWWGMVVTTLTSPMTSGMDIATTAASSNLGQTGAAPLGTATQATVPAFFGLRGEDAGTQATRVIELEDSGAEVQGLDGEHADLQGAAVETTTTDVEVAVDHRAGLATDRGWMRLLPLPRGLLL